MTVASALQRAPASLSIFSRCVSLALITVALCVNGTDHDPVVDTSHLYEPTLYRTRWLVPLANWDGEYFLHMASEGAYQELHTTAFYPGYPWLMRLVKPPSLPLLETGLLLNVVLQFLACQLLFRWVQRRASERIATVACLLYCFGPNSVFQSALYNHNLFDCLCFGAACCLDGDSPWAAATLGLLATVTRSNGLLFLFPLFFWTLFSSPILYKKASISDFFVHWTSAAAQATAVVMPYIGLLGTGYEQFCAGGPGLRLESLPLDMLRGFSTFVYIVVKAPPPPATAFRDFCSSRWPSIYDYIQSEYWNVGFLSYWKFSKADRFLAAAPVYASVGLALRLHVSTRKQWVSVDTGHLLSSALFTLILLMKFNVEIVSRALSSQPLVYLALAEFAISRPKHGRFLLFWAILLYIIGHFYFVWWMPFT
ncbi:MAG: uncharacterized protein KVP18_001998 [Porospora cf. gigantea A]|uniref:uncharacterized protein n=1 Tax=Porospora cf. gigantea A TaxID=2853593 RepID=UPI00355A4AF2|nr:MAG: hypothetical protein KVP18_001998 [Porospora cf. gigantea A]